jgi:hypothetical protein
VDYSGQTDLHFPTALSGLSRRRQILAVSITQDFEIRDSLEIGGIAGQRFCPMTACSGGNPEIVLGSSGKSFFPRRKATIRP